MRTSHVRTVYTYTFLVLSTSILAVSIERRGQGENMVNTWSNEEMIKLIELWSEDSIQAQLEGLKRNAVHSFQIR